jgi:uncharacterized protein
MVGILRAKNALRMTNTSDRSFPMIKTIGSGISFAVKVHPRAKKNAITGMVGEVYKLSLTAPALEGRANQACVEFFAELFKVPRSSVTIASGERSRNKVIRVDGVTEAHAEQSLSAARPKGERS